MTNSTLRRRARLGRRTPIKSTRRSPVTQETRNLMAKRSDGLCEIGITEVCKRRGYRLRSGWQYSHRVRVANSPTHGPEGGCVSCAECHYAVEEIAPRRWVEACGWRLPFSTPDPGAVPVLIRCMTWVYLTKSGTYRKAEA